MKFCEKSYEFTQTHCSNSALLQKIFISKLKNKRVKLI